MVSNLVGVFVKHRTYLRKGQVKGVYAWDGSARFLVYITNDVIDDKFDDWDASDCVLIPDPNEGNGPYR